MGKIVSSIKVPARMEFLDEVLSMVRKIMESECNGAKHAISVEIVVEEIFTNIAEYAYERPHVGDAFITCEFYQEPVILKIIFEDEGVPYNPLEHRDPDITQDLEEREIGGLGIFMTKKIMDEVYYEYRDGKNVFTIEKKLSD